MKPNFDNLNMTFATTYNWGVEFRNNPYPEFINKGYTVTNVKEELGVIVEKQWTIGHKVVTIPHQIGQTTLSIDFHDSGDLSFFHYLDDWYRRFEEAKGVKSYDRLVELVRVTKYTQEGKEVSKTDYYVYPYGTLMYNGSSEAQLLTGSASFRVVKRKVIK